MLRADNPNAIDIFLLKLVGSGRILSAALTRQIRG